MTTTPTVWKPEFRLNFFNDVLQANAAVTDIGGGRFVAVWDDFDDSVANSGAVNVVGQVFDAEGNPFGDPFQVNVTGVNGLQSNPSLVSRPGGGFAVAYQADTGSGERIAVDLFDANGGHVSGIIVQADDADKVSDPSIAMRSDGSYFVTYLREDAGDDTFDVVGRPVSAGGTVGSEVVIFDTSDDEKRPAEIAALSDGNYVVASVILTSDRDPYFKIVGQNGATVAGAFPTSQSFSEETDVQVAALVGGGFVIAWASAGGSGDIQYGVYANNGGLVKVLGGLSGGFTANATTAGQQSSPDVATLADGGFVIVWRDVARDAIYGQRFDAAGEKVGGEFLASDDDLFEPAVAGLGDGRFITAAHSNVSINADVFATIFDPREKSIDGTVDDNVITSRADGATVRGLDGADTLLGQAAADVLDGGRGNDRLKGGLGKDLLTGGTQKDTFVFDFPVSSKSAAKAHKDKVLDFSHRDDTIEFDADQFTLLAAGKLKGKDFGSGTGAATKDKHLVYWNEKNGKLYYDANGSAQKGKGDIEIAKFNKDADIDAGDILIA